MVVYSADRRYGAYAMGVYGANAVSRGGGGSGPAPRLSGFGGVAGSDMGWPEFLGGAVAAEDDRIPTHTPMHAIVLGISTGIAVHIAVKLIDKYVFGERIKP